MYYSNIAFGLIVLGLIGILHPAVIKGEYYFGRMVWIVFAVLGCVFSISSLMTKGTLGNLYSVISFLCFWSVYEVFEQVKRVDRGSFPEGKYHRKRNMCVTRKSKIVEEFVER